MSSRDHIPATPLPHDCTQEHRLQAIEQRVSEHGHALTQHAIALTDGKIEFASIKKDLAQIIQAQAELKVALLTKPSSIGEKIADAAIHWCVPAVILGLLYVFAKSGQIPGVHP
jgi:hypothetical protein